MTSQRTRRARRGDGGYRQRGQSWELKFPAADPSTGVRRSRYVTLKPVDGRALAESEVRKRLRALVKAADDGEFIAPAKQTLGSILDAWDRALAVSPKTSERYRELVKLHIRPHLGEMRLQALRPTRIEGFYNDLRCGRGPDGKDGRRPLAARTIGHVHRLLVKILSTAERDGLVASNAARRAERPKVERTEIESLSEEQVREVLTKLRGRPLFLIAALGLATGMRRGEMLALRWRNVDLDAAELQVQQSLEETNEGLRFKAPKTRYGRRTISLPSFIVAELRAHRATQAVERLALGLGKDHDDALVLRRPDGSPMLPDSVSSEWRRAVVSLKLPKVSLHALRHTHASQLIASGMDVLTISRRLGHGAPSITLDVYSHLFKPTDKGAAAVFDKAFGALQAE